MQGAILNQPKWSFSTWIFKVAGKILPLAAPPFLFMSMEQKNTKSHQKKSIEIH